MAELVSREIEQEATRGEESVFSPCPPLDPPHRSISERKTCSIE